MTSTFFKMVKEAPASFRLYICSPYDIPENVNFDVASDSYLKKAFLTNLAKSKENLQVTRRPEAVGTNILLLHEKKEAAIDALEKSGNKSASYNIVTLEIPSKDFLAGSVIDLKQNYIKSCEVYNKELAPKAQFKS